MKTPNKKPERRKRAFECELKNTYEIKNLNDMARIHDEKVNKIAECNLLHNIISPPKRTKILNIHYYPIIHVYMNNRKGRAKFKNF